MRVNALYLRSMAKQAKRVEQVDSVIVRFAGDSGDGMQLTGGRFTSETAVLGNDLSTCPDFPAEIRAPAGSLPGVSGFQVHFADHDILTPGDRPNVLVAMNPAALKTNLDDLPKGGTLIVDTDAFADRNLQKAGYPADRGHARVHREEVRVEAGDRAREPDGLQGGLRIRRDDGGLRGPVRGAAGAAPAGHLPQHHRQHGDRVRARGRLGQDRAAALPRRLPDHARVGDPGGAGAAQEL